MWEQRAHLTLPDPLAPGTEADVWLGPLMRNVWFHRIIAHHRASAHYCANAICDEGVADGESNNPVPAIVRAMMAADPEFAAKMEGATQ